MASETYTTNIIAEFKKNIDVNKEYTIEELNEIITASYKKFNKKEPSEYNKFIKQTISDLREQNPEEKDPKNLLKIAASKWSDKQKENNDNSVRQITKNIINKEKLEYETPVIGKKEKIKNSKKS